MVWVAAVLLLIAGTASGHEFWVEPSTFEAAPGAEVGFRLFVGDGFPGEPYARNPKHLDRFEIHGPSGRAPVEGRIGAEPAGHAVLQEPGVHVLAYQSHGSRIDLEPEAFESYLAEVGLERILERRTERGDEQQPGRESFSRHAKTLVAVGGRSQPGFSRVVGLTLELVPEASPLELPPGGTLPLRVLYRGDPVEGVLVRAWREGDSGVLSDGRTDPTGLARLSIDRPGCWMVTAVHMVEAPPDSGADWRSLWASLTFATRARAACRDA